MTVAHAFGDGDDVGHYTLLFKTPEIVAEPAIADLHLVRDSHSTALAYQPVNFLEVSMWQRDPAGVAIDALGDEASDPFVPGLDRLDRRLDIGDVAGRRIRAAMGTPVSALSRCSPEMVWSASR